MLQAYNRAAKHAIALRNSSVKLLRGLHPSGYTPVRHIGKARLDYSPVHPILCFVLGIKTQYIFKLKMFSNTHMYTTILYHKRNPSVKAIWFYNNPGLKSTKHSLLAKRCKAMEVYAVLSYQRLYICLKPHATLVFFLSVVAISVNCERRTPAIDSWHQLSGLTELVCESSQHIARSKLPLVPFVYMRLLLRVSLSVGYLTTGLGF